MTKKRIKELMAVIHEMDNIKLLMTTVAVSKALAVAEYLMHPNKQEIEEEFALYMSAMMGRLEPKMIKKTGWMGADQEQHDY